MEFTYSPELLAYMERTGKRILAVEAVVPRHSEFEISELYLHFIKERQAAYLKEKRGFREFCTEHGLVLLPDYRLDYQSVIHFGLKRFLCFRLLTQSGISF